MEEEDIRKTGTRGLQGLPGLNRRRNPLDAYDGGGSRGISSTMRMLESPVKQEVGLELASLGYGNSKYDDEIIDMQQARDINEFRAQEQPWYDQLANGAIKMLSTAGTTFIDGTLGTLVGLGTGLANLADNDPSTGFWRGMWDNAVSNAMADINDAMEENFKNYRTHWEDNASVFERMFSGISAANFWGDSILKNAGFTIGAAGAIWATSGLGGALKGVGALGKAAKWLKLARTGAEGLEATRGGKVASWIAKTFISTQGEAAIEAVNARRDNEKEMESNISNRREELLKDIDYECQSLLANGEDPSNVENYRAKRITEIDQSIDIYRQQMQKELEDAGNLTYAANIAALSLSNNLTLGSLIRGGYGTSKSLLASAMKTVDGKVIESPTDIAKALLRGNLRFKAPELNNTTAKALGHWALTSTQEGLEEGVQSLASTTTQMHTQAAMNKFAGTQTILGDMINPNAKEDLDSYGNALVQAYQTQFGSLNSPGWEEVMAGFISGALGVPGMHQNKEGKWRPTMNGGIFESLEYVKGENNAIQETADKVNKYLTDNKYGERVRNAIAKIAINREKQKALDDGDVKVFKNAEMKELLSDALTFKELGMLDEYLGMYQELAEGLTDQDVAEFRAAIKTEDSSSITSLDKKTDDELKALYQNKATTTLDKLNEIISTYDAFENSYGDKFSDDTRRFALMELTYKDSLLWDTYRRIDEMSKENESLQSKGNLTPIEEEKIKSNNKAISELQKQARDLREEVNEYKNNPKNLQGIVEDAISEYQKLELYKKSEEALKKYQEATTLQDVIDVYQHSPAEDREKVLDLAIEQSEGETKELLTKYRNFMGDVNTLSELITDRFSSENPEELQANLMNLSTFLRILNMAAQDILSDDSPVLSRENLKDKLTAKLKEWQDTYTENDVARQGVQLTEEGNFNFSELIDNGTLNLDEDFVRVLDDPDTGESHLEIAPNSKAEEIAKAVMYTKQMAPLIDHMNYFIDSLDKLDELRETAKKKKTKKEKKEKKTKKEKTEKKKVEKVIFDEESDAEQEDESWDDEEDREDEVAEVKRDNGDEESKPKSSSPMSITEKKFYDTTTIKDKDGREYHSYKKKAGKNANKATKESMSKKLDKTARVLGTLETLLEGAKSDKVKKAKLEEFLNKSNSMLFNAKLVADLNKILNRYGHLLKPTKAKESNKGKHDNERGQNLEDSSTSLNGNQSPEYVSSELSSDKAKMVRVTRQKSGTPLQNWLRDKGYNIQEVIDRYLGRIVERDIDKDTKDKTPVYYIHTEEQPNVVFLGMRYSDVEDIIPRDRVKLIITQNGEYVLIGTLGWEEVRPGTQDMYNSILEETQEFHTSPAENFEIVFKPVQQVIDQIFSDSNLSGILSNSDKEKLLIVLKKRLNELTSDTPSGEPFLGWESEIEKAFTEANVTGSLKGVAISANELWGSLSNYAKDDKLKPALISALSLAEKSLSSNNTSSWVTNTSHTNRIKDITGGAKVKQTLSDNESQVRDLRELLEGDRNPYRLDIEDFGWTVVEGTEEKPRQKYINAEEDKVYNITGKPGQVYLHIPASNGMSVPIYMETLFFQELEEDTPLMDEIKRWIDVLADPSADMEEKRRAIAELNALLIFSRPNQIHLNDNESSFAPNTIYITRNGSRIKIIDFNKGIGTSEDLLEAILSINPRINLSTTNLTNNPRLYLDSGVLRTDIAMLGTVNSKFFLYPTDSNNEFIENKPHKFSETFSRGVTRERVYLQRRYVYFNEDHFEDAQHNIIEDEDGSLQVAYDIKNDRYKPILVNEVAYYDVGEVMYVDNGHGGLDIIDDELRNKVLKANKRGRQADRRKERVEEESKKPKESTPKVRESEKKENKDKTSVSIIRPSYFSSMKGQLGDKVSKWDYYTEDDRNTRDTREGVLILGISWQSVVLPSITFAIDSGILGEEYRIPIDTEPNVIDSEKAREALKQLKRLGIRTPDQLIEYVENRTSETSQSEPTNQQKQNEPEVLNERIAIHSSWAGNGDSIIYGKGDVMAGSLDPRGFTRAIGNSTIAQHNLAVMKAQHPDLVIRQVGGTDTAPIVYAEYTNSRGQKVGVIAQRGGNRDGARSITIYRPLTNSEITDLVNYLQNTIALNNTDSPKEIDALLNRSVQKPSVTKKTKSKTFSNGTNLNEESSAEDLDKRRNDKTLLGVLRARENEAKVDALYELVNSKFGIEIEEDEELIKVLKSKGIDLSSNDLDTIIDIINGCR